MPDQDIALMAHLMRRAGFGAHRDQLEKLVEKGYEQVVDELVEPGKHNVPKVDQDLIIRFHPDLETPWAPPGCSDWMLYHFLASERQLEEKMVLFWHMLFPTGNAKVDNPSELVAQTDMFRDYGLGNYRDLLIELAKDPAMIFWLDNNYNHKDEPNENWGRELLELFSMGQGNYTEKDVFECARAFTGWTIAPKMPRQPFGRYDRWKFLYNADDHDDGEKELLGHRGCFNGGDVIEIIARQPATARFMARHLYNFFVADEVQVPAWLDVPPRDAVAVNQIGDAFVNSNFSIAETLRFLFNSDFFKEAMYRKVKSPAEVVVSAMRIVGDFKYPRPGLELYANESEYMGQALLDPPSVEGWHTGHEWIDSGSLVRRINFCADAFGNVEYPGVRSIINRIKEQGITSPPEIVDACLDLIGPVEVQERTHEELVALAQQNGELNWDTDEESKKSGEKIGNTLALIVSSREFQFE